MEGEGKRRLRAKNEEICAALELDRDTAERAWSLFASLDDTYTLAGQPSHWIGLSVYAECMRNSPAFHRNGESDAALEGNRISFTKVLRLCDLSVSDFFAKVKNWTEMTSVPDTFKKTVDKLEKNFQVTVVLFKKLRKIFYHIFLPTDPAKSTKNEKKTIKSSPCTSSLLFEFCWYLFICVKGEFKDLSDDLVNMYHVLLCCVDLIFANAYSAQRKDIVDPKFNALPSNWTSSKNKSSDPPCIISYLCDKYGASALDAKKIKHYNMKVILENFFKKEFLKGNSEKFLCLLDAANFNYNLMSLSQIYGTYMLNVGEFDERVLLVDCGTGSKLNDHEISKAISSYETVALVPSTPLTGRQYLNIKNDNLTPVSKAIQPLIKLQDYLLGHSNSPSPVLIGLLEKCAENPVEMIVSRQKDMAIQFLSSYSKIFSEDITGHRLNLIEVFYYKLSEQILLEEQTKRPNIDTQIFYNEMFHKSLFACCTEIVIFACQPGNPRFPWVLDCFELDAFYFYKIIELVVLTIRERLSRDVIKHLSTIEENILDSLSWKSESPLWSKIKELNELIPQYCDVKINDYNRLIPPTGIMLPSTSSDRSTNPTDIPTKSQLFKDTPIKPGQSLLSQNLNDTNGEFQENGSCASSSSNNVPNIPQRRTGSLERLCLKTFFRKFYNLAYTRLQNLCDNLRLNDERLIIKIWTCLEHGIIHQTHLMRDRHLDQILMCIVYAMCKISNNETNNVNRTFTEIMRCYRLQPQAKNHIYRDVLLSTNLAESDDENISPSTSANPEVPTRGDLIKFYNTVFVHSMQKLIKIFSKETTEQSDGNEVEQTEINLPTLSPLPEIRRNNGASPGAHRISDNHRLYVSSLTPVAGEVNQQARFSCIFTSTTDLQHINNLMCPDEKRTIKRPFLLGENDGPDKKIQRRCF